MQGTPNRSREAGATLFIVAGGLVMLLGMSALAIDLVSFYVARTEAQRAADAAALAGASMFISLGCTNEGCVPGGPQEAPATQRAIDAAVQNTVSGQAPSAATVDVAFSYPNAQEPQITVTVHRDSAHSNALPTYFARIFGIATVDMSTSAKAEAYNPSGGNVSVGLTCLRPFLVPNCDPGHPVPSTNAQANSNCGAVACPFELRRGCLSSGHCARYNLLSVQFLRSGRPRQHRKSGRVQSNHSSTERRCDWV
jgi:hypothetical protein